jgi:hypothetical protein
MVFALMRASVSISRIAGRELPDDRDRCGESE